MVSLMQQMLFEIITATAENNVMDSWILARPGFVF